MKQKILKSIAFIFLGLVSGCGESEEDNAATRRDRISESCQIACGVSPTLCDDAPGPAPQPPCPQMCADLMVAQMNEIEKNAAKKNKGDKVASCQEALLALFACDAPVSCEEKKASGMMEVPPQCVPDFEHYVVMCVAEEIVDLGVTLGPGDA